MLKDLGVEIKDAGRKASSSGSGVKSEAGGTDLHAKLEANKSGGEKSGGATPKAKSMSLLDKLKMLDDDAEDPKDTE